MVQKYSAAITAIAITLVGALAQITGGVTWTDAVQLALLGVGAIVIYVAPLLDGKWRARVKVGAAIAIAVLTALVPLVIPNHVWNGQEIAMVVLAALQALGAQIGTHLRIESGEEAAAPEPSDGERFVVEDGI